ncbi:hypothetical protein SBOR_8346 [Sclerotinia borealis F-4128]|uniref:Piwi domain-containing protein n=1 Tax=Sclerotinia borealis (strain F-4128) TaxID=1432307 RepID=W9C678_SCLBF|nr:hypothetical protein SBOR_8346 [Sclerotinia borealis F-4128]
MGVGQQRRTNQGPDSSAGNPGQQQQSRPSGPPSVAGGPQASSSGRPLSAGFDGPGEPKTNPFGPGLGFDPARDPGKDESRKFNTRVELPCYRDNYDIPASSILPARPGYNTNGKAVSIRVNQYKVLDAPRNDIYQYDILVGQGGEKMGLIKKVWESRPVQAELAKHGKMWLWDGNKIAWCANPMARGEVRVPVDLDVENGRPPNEDRIIYCIIKQTTTIRMAALHAYLNKQIEFDNSVLCAINFLDHMLRQWPSEQFTVQKRSFFARGPNRCPLDKTIEAMKGVYSSIRLCNHVAEGNAIRGLAINVDVANGTFWTSQDVMQAARNVCGLRSNRALNWDVFRQNLLPRLNEKGTRYEKSSDFKTLDKMKKLKFHLKHHGKQEDKRVYTIKAFTYPKHEKYFKTGLNAKNQCFTPKDTNKEISVYDYFKKKYNITLQYWWAPLIETERAGWFPMEVCTLLPNQKYQFKLDPDQTAAMIKFAVTRPKVRLESIEHGLGMLKWDEDPYLSHFGCKIEKKMTTTQARLLPNPVIQFDRATIDPKTSGRWDLRGKKFLYPNPEPLNSWAVVIVGDCIQVPAVKNFLQVFIQTYIGHGGKVQNKNPPIVPCANKVEMIADGVQYARTQAGQQTKQTPQILFFILGGRDSFIYERFKKNNECRFGMVSQMMNVAHVSKAQPQYCSNVCMKVNAKLGGTTCKVADTKPPKPFFSRPTMIIGADVSHATPGSPQSSMACLTMSMDSTACRYAAAVQTNGHRVEMISKDNIKSMMIPLFRQWITKVGKGSGPQHIYYFRDGVSEGQFEHVINQEIKDMKDALGEAFGAQGASIRWTVTVCTKRHHLRFFPRDGDMAAGDKNGNALPGTLVERDITHPFEYDFYLSSHSAIQGTARPTHYQVIMDEAKIPVNDFQRMVYQHCYQYMRSTTPVSLYPAVYYAHIASNRARAHEAQGFSAGPRGGEKFLERQQAEAAERVARGESRPATSQTGSSNLVQDVPLLPLGTINAADNVSLDVLIKIRTGMWYI